MATPSETCERHVHVELFQYHDVHRRRGHCGIEMFIFTDGRVVVIATERSDNPGMSVTIAAEQIADAVCRQMSIEPHRLVWIEHYPAEKCPVCRGCKTEIRCRACDGRGVRRERATYDRVRFAVIDTRAEPMFDDPAWSPMTDCDWHELGLEPRG
jgi:hypothetical protein